MKLFRQTFLTISVLVFALASTAQESSKAFVRPLSVTMNKAWEVTWNKFYHPQTNQFYDYLSSYEPGKGLSHLPFRAEVKQQKPNFYGYDTGMEDCMISAGVMLSLIIDKHIVTRNPELATKANEVLEGIYKSLTVHGQPGFLARCICTDDNQSIYINSSRDQYTHAVYGLWLLYRSKLASDKMKFKIRFILSDIADRMIRNVILENDYDFLRADNTRDSRKISRMWNVSGHEAARLPMIYAAAWDVTRRKEYYEQYNKYIDEAIDQSLNFSEDRPTYALLQMQSSLELISVVDSNRNFEGKIDELKNKIAKICIERANRAFLQGENLDLSMPGTDWRLEGEGLYPRGEYRKVWYCIRESGEAALTQLMSGDGLSTDQQHVLKMAINRLDFNQVSSSGIFYLQAAYWKARRLGIETFGNQ